MAAPDIELADALVEDLNDTERNWSLNFKAVRSWKPLWIGKEQLTGVQCLVNPWPIVSVEAEGRDSAKFEYSIDFGFAKRLSEKNTEEIDDLRDLVDAAVDRYIVTNFTVADVGTFVSLRRLDEYVTFDPTRINRTLDGNRTNYTGDFLSMFRVPYRLLEA